MASIQEFHPGAPIVIIDDNSTAATPIDGEGGPVIIQSEFPGAGESLPYYYFLKHRWAKRMICMHDSMYLRRAFTSEELVGEGAFLWHFVTHAWDNNPRIEKILNDKRSLIAFNRNKAAWYGCFGGMMYCTYAALRRVEKQYGIFADCVQRISTRADRMAFERILGLVMFHAGVVSASRYSIQGNIHAYPLNFKEKLDPRLLEAIQAKYPGACLKEWCGR